MAAESVLANRDATVGCSLANRAWTFSERISSRLWPRKQRESIQGRLAGALVQCRPHLVFQSIAASRQVAAGIEGLLKAMNFGNQCLGGRCCRFALLRENNWGHPGISLFVSSLQRLACDTHGLASHSADVSRLSSVSQ